MDLEDRITELKDNYSWLDTLFYRLEYEIIRLQQEYLNMSLRAYDEVKSGFRGYLSLFFRSACFVWLLVPLTAYIGLYVLQETFIHSIWWAMK